MATKKTNLDRKAIEKRLGFDPGALLPQLAALAARLSPAKPSEAFADLWLELGWIDEPKWASRQREHLPEGVAAFGRSGGDQELFALVMDDDALSADERPVAVVSGDSAEVVAPSLAAFLGLLTVGHGGMVARGISDSRWKSARKEHHGDDKPRLERMAALSSALLELPGVERPASPSAVTQAAPDRAFTWPGDEGGEGDEADEGEEGDERKAGAGGKQGPGGLSLAHAPLERARQAYAAMYRAADAGRDDDALLFARFAAEHPMYEARALLVGAGALFRLGEKGEAAKAARALVDAWLDDRWPDADKPHARREVGRDEVIELVDLALRGRDHASLRARVEQAGEIDLPSGDVL